MTANSLSDETTLLRPAPVYSYAAHGNLYLNVTSRCSLRCGFCPKFSNEWVVDGCDLRLRHEPTAAMVLAAVADPGAYGEIVFCGLGEPTLRLPVVLEVAQALRARGARIRLNTDGLGSHVHGRDITPELGRCIDAVSISLNAQDEATYKRHCRPRLPGSYAAVRDFIARARDHFPDVTVTAIEGLAGVDISACEDIARGLGVKFRKRVLDVVG